MKVIKKLIKEGVLMSKYNLDKLDTKDRYRMLDRMRGDCEYCINSGSNKHLWVVNDPKTHCDLMRELYDSLEDKPDWLSLEDIDRFEKALLGESLKEDLSNMTAEEAAKKWQSIDGGELSETDDSYFVTTDYSEYESDEYEFFKNGKTPAVVYRCLRDDGYEDWAHYDSFEDFFRDNAIDESIEEDTVKTSDGKWTNKGKEGTHGKFKTKKQADAQRKAMFANGYHENLTVEEDKEAFEQEFGE